MRCAKCGAELKPGARFCGRCGTTVTAFDERPVTPPVTRLSGVNRMPQGIAMGVNERIVKQYKIGRYTFRQGSIEVIVTNKRVIRYEESSLFGMQNNQIDEINIDSVHGVSTHMRRSISVLGMIFAVLFLVLGLVALFGDLGIGYRKSGMEYIAGFVMLAVCAVIVYASLKPTVEFAMMGSVGNFALGTVVNSRGRMFRNDNNSLIFQFKPTAETTVMLKEIGACVYDLKTLGDKAIEKWS